MGKLGILALAVALCATAVAQSRVSMGRPAAGPVAMGGRHFGAGISVVEGGHRHPFGRSPFFYGYGAPYYFYSDDYEPYDLQYARSEPATQPVPLAQANPEPLPEPVLL